MPNNDSISWQAPEFRHYEKNAGWYTTLVAVAILVITFFVIVQKDYFAAASMGILAVLIIMFSRHVPKIINIAISEKGITAGNIIYPYAQLKHFWIVDNARHKTLNLESTALINRVIVIEMEDQDADEVRAYLRQYLPEHDQAHETMSQRISHRFRF
ncbi:MAG TPA: hypothetical protein VHA30_03340 [Patescibacteria group bacterium]|nr:hypothetical protein [Patescibacteria group bacterium]